jgi:hypothetical protein
MWVEKLMSDGVTFYNKKQMEVKSIIANYIFPPPKWRRE